MAAEREVLKLGNRELFSSEVEAYLDSQRVLQQRDVPEVAPRPWYVRFFLSSCFYLSVAGALGGLLGWAIIEPFIDDGMLQNPDPQKRAFQLAFTILAFPLVTASIALVLGAAEGLISRNPLRACISAAVGFGIGLAGGLLAFLPTEMIFGVMASLANNFAPANTPPGTRFKGISLLILMMGRASAWAMSGIPAGIGQGVAIREKKVIVNGILGGVMGGILGGLLFDPINYLLTPVGKPADLSRAVGFTVIGLMVGLFVGIVEQWTKTAWLLMREGALAGKQFIIYKDPTVLGSSPKADIYLFKDPAIEPRHALIHNRGGRYEIEDQKTEDGTYVNGIPINKRVLQAGDKIVLGKTVLEFALRDVK